LIENTGKTVIVEKGERERCGGRKKRERERESINNCIKVKPRILLKIIKVKTM
jgi:hypothetical protein